MTTYNNVIEVFRYFAENHRQINSFHVGELSEFQSKQNVYSTMIVISQPSEITKRVIKINFNCFFIDLLNRDNSNLEEVQSDMLLISNDFIKYIDKNFNNGSITFRISDDIITSEPFVEILDDILAGWMINFSIEYQFNNTCDIPFRIVQPEPQEQTKTINFNFNSQECIINVEDIEQDDVVIFLISKPFLQEDTLVTIYYNCEDECVYYQGNPISSGTSVWFRENQRDGGLIVALQLLRDGELIDFDVRLVRFIEN